MRNATTRLFLAALATLTVLAALGTRAAPAGAGPAVAQFESAPTAVGRVLRLENQRLEMMRDVAAWKWLHHVAVSAPGRERVVIGAAGALARGAGLPVPAVERLFSLQVRLASREESRLQARWRARGYDGPADPPSLSQELRPRLDRLTQSLLQALYLAGPELARADLVQHYAGDASRRLSAPGWSAANRRELLLDLAAVGAPSGPALPRIRAVHLLRVGTTGDYAPFSLERDGRLSGADITLAHSLAAALGARVVFVRTSWPSLLADLAAGHFDLAMSGISVTPARAALAFFSTPYATGGKTLLVRCADAHRFASLAALDQPGETVIVNPGGTNQQFVSTHLHRARMRVFADNRRIFDEILAHRADAMITDDIEVQLQTRGHPGLCRGLPGTLTREDKAILMPKDPALRAAVNGWLAGALAQGRPAALIQAASSAAP